MRITMLENEYWWGGIVNLGETLPYDKDSDCELDLGTIKLSLDQSAPLFVPPEDDISGAISRFGSGSGTAR